MRRIILSVFSLFIFASCLISGSLILSSCKELNEIGGGVSNSQDFSDEKDHENQEIVANKTDINFNIITRCYSSTNVYSESSFGGTGIADYVGDITLYWYQEGGKL